MSKRAGTVVTMEDLVEAIGVDASRYALARYSSWLAIYAHLSNALPRDDRRTLAEGLDAGPRGDLQAINARLLRSAPIVRRAARDAYDSYLKANRVERGIESYDAVVRLVLGSVFDESWTPRMR